MPRGFFGGGGGGRILGRSIKKGALKFLLSFMAAGEKKGKLKCMLWGFVSGHFMWLGLDLFVKWMVAKEMARNISVG